ncbi:MAG: hypothetical protein BMS9Abin05_2492 [Rhodothermia bacterium]|nr:MAG: hypothetical protein BMS9Abin05_2492 [Rhodothermia bacterium]
MLLSGVSQAQTPTPVIGSCARPLARAVLDNNNVQAELFNAGILRYEVPAGSGSYAIQTTDIWFGGYVEGQLRVAGERWGGWELWPGRLIPGAVLPDPDDCSAYDRMFEVTREDLEQYALNGIVSTNLAGWPWDLGAPTLDGDGNPSNYNLEAGDRPELIGHQRFWWVMNDMGNVHAESKSPPLGIEVQGSAAAMRDPREAIDNTTIYSYRVINRLTVPIDSMFMGVYSEADLGWWNEIFVGVDTTIGMSFAYNSVNENHEYYGGAPPAIGMVLIKGWPSASDEMDNDYDGEVDEPGEEAGFSHFMQWCGDEDIHRAWEKYNTMTGYCRWGEPITYGGRGIGGTTRTRFQWTGDPVTGAYWSAMNTDSLGTVWNEGRRPGSVSSFGPFRLGSGEFAEFTFAYVWAQGKTNLDSITKLRAAASGIKSTYDELYLRQPEFPLTGAFSDSFQNRMSLLHPNPADENVTVTFTVAESARVRLQLFDVLGREATTLMDGFSAPGVYTERFSVQDLSSGLYVYRVAIGRATATGTLIVQH